MSTPTGHEHPGAGTQPAAAGPQPPSGEPVVRSGKAPAAHGPFRPGGDPELVAGSPAPTTAAYAPTGQHDLPGDHDGRPVLVIGEALIDVVERDGEEPREHPGGSPANVAVGLGRLGRPVELVTWFGVDDRGARLRSHLEQEHVTVSAGSAGAARTSTARARLDAAGAASYVFDLDWAPPAPAPIRAPLHIHTGSIAAVLQPGARTVAAAVAEHRPTATVSYDPNCRPDLMGDAATAREPIEALVAAADVVKASDEDLAWLYPGTDPAEAARRWAGAGPAVVILTRGGAGSWAVTAGGVELSVPPVPVEVVDTVGAGDSYMAGVLDGLWAAGLLGAERRTALHAVGEAVLAGVLSHAARIAGITVSRAGANPPTRAELAAAR